MSRPNFPHVWLITAITLAGCGTTLIRDDITREADGWNLTVQRLTDGPDETTVGGFGTTRYEPHDGQRFIHVNVRFRNASTQTRVFSYDGCALDSNGEQILPALVTRYNGVKSVMPTNESYPPGDTNYRTLTFSYPKGPLPKHLKCGLVTFDIPAPTAAP